MEYKSPTDGPSIKRGDWLMLVLKMPTTSGLQSY